MRTNDPPVAYQLFLLVVSALALGLLGLDLVSDLSPETRMAIAYVDTAICAVFLGDFVFCLRRAEDRRRYLIRYGWIDLLASIPAVDVLRAGRAVRVLRILRLLRGVKSSRVLVSYFVAHRALSAFWTAVLAGIVALTFASIAILHVEGPNAPIATAEDALWWSIVTSTTVGYGDLYPTTSAGRLIGAGLMVVGVAIVGVLTAVVASTLADSHDEGDAIAALRAEIAELKTLVESGVRDRA